MSVDFHNNNKLNNFNVTGKGLCISSLISDTKTLATR
jgi:hypothetical protein